jgi:hypothetical protein
MKSVVIVVSSKSVGHHHPLRVPALFGLTNVLKTGQVI